MAAQQQRDRSGNHWYVGPRDPEGYLRRLRCHSPAIDGGALRYIEEALRAFNCLIVEAVIVKAGRQPRRVSEGSASNAFLDHQGVIQSKINTSGSIVYRRCRAGVGLGHHQATASGPGRA